jgi:Restriction endonuclease
LLEVAVIKEFSMVAIARTIPADPSMNQRQKPERKKNTGIPYEYAVQRIFQEILDRERDRTIKVDRNVQVQGLSACHQIDVLWRFIVAGIEHLTLVQARDWNQKIKQESVFAFREILNDIPGQPRGVIVTRTGFQTGARRYAEDHGIKLFILRQTTPGITMTDISYATMKAEACHLPGGGLGVLFRTTVFRPEPHIELVLEQSGRLPKSFEAAPYHEIQLFNAQKLATGTLRDVLADFVSTMAKNNQLTESLTKDFQDPTFIRSTGSKRFFRLHSLRAKIDIVKEELPPIRLKPPGFVDFVLEDFETGKKQSFVQPVMKNGK